MIINLKFKIITIIFGLLLFILNSNYIFSLFSVSDEKNLKVFIEEVQKEYETFNKVCINQIDLSLDKKQKISEEKINSININTILMLYILIYLSNNIKFPN